MLGHKRTLPLWQQRRRRLLVLERALGPDRAGTGVNRMSTSEQSVLAQKTADRKTAEERWQAWLRGKL